MLKMQGRLPCLKGLPSMMLLNYVILQRRRRDEADCDDPIANRSGEPGRAGAHVFGSSREPVFLCGGMKAEAVIATGASRLDPREGIISLTCISANREYRSRWRRRGSSPRAPARG
jgi:hypothetical protein